MKHRYSLEQFREAVNSSTSIRQTLIKLGIKSEGGNYRVVHHYAKKYQVSLEHFTGKGWSKGKSLPRRPYNTYLTVNSRIQSHKLRKNLIKNEIFEPKCSSCSLTTWMNQPIPLELDHINGIHDDNRIVNLRLLCPNCHALTPTYRGKNKVKSKLGSGLP